jgi:alcohol dehydrogenase class IV
MLATNGGGLLDYADDWSRVAQPGIPLIVVPTTVGSGSEMTRGAVFKDPERHSKLVIVHDLLAARAAVLDPRLLDTLPSSVTAATGCDALTQAIEGVLSSAASAWTDALHLHAIRMIRASLARAVADSADTEAMGTMQQAAAMVGAALGNSGVGAAHAVANTLGGHYPIPHGLACAVMLQPVLRLNAAAAPQPTAAIATALGVSTGNGAAADAVVEEVGRLLAAAGATWRLREFGVEEADLERIAPEAESHSDMATNPVQPTVDEVLGLLREAW